MIRKFFSDIFSGFFTVKRLKSALMTFVAFAIAALGVAVANAEQLGVLADLQTWLTALGTPASVVALIMIFINEMLRQYSSNRNIQKSANRSQAQFAAAPPSKGGVEVY